MIQAVFIDRDGTIGGSDEVVLPGEFKIFPFVEETFRLLKQHDIKILSFTNQPGISRGEATKEQFENELIEFGFDGVYLCPHQHQEGCKCRKPAPGMLHEASQRYDLDLKKCAVIGDRWTDLMAAQQVGSIKILVKTGAGKEAYQKYLNKEYYGKWAETTQDYVAENLQDAVHWLLKKS